MEKHVATITLQTESKTWLRSLCLDEPPNPKDVEFYYKHLCGFTDAVITVGIQSVPVDFNDQLLSVGDKEPTEFPVFNLTTITEAKRDEYCHYVNQLCEMERSRSRMSMERPDKRLTSTVSRIRGQRKWVNDLLSSLKADPVRRPQSHRNELEVREVETVPAAWLFAPTAAPMRMDQGSLLIADKSVGLVWEHKLGTDLYPDFVVSRRLTTISWAFQHSSSSSLLDAVVAWLVAKHPDGWISDAEATVDACLSPFQGVEGTGAEGTAEGTAEGKGEGTAATAGNAKRPRKPRDAATKKESVSVLLQRIEASMLFSKAEVPDVEPLSIPIFVKLVDYMARSYGIPKEAYADNPAVSAVLQRWSQSLLGFSGKTKPLLSSWQEVWELIAANKGKREKVVSAARVSLLISTMDAWDLTESTVMTEDTKRDLWEQWMGIFSDRELVQYKGAKIPLSEMEERARAYLNRFLPRAPFASLQRRFRDQLVAVLTKRGYSSTSMSGVVCVVGARYRAAAAAEGPKAAEAAEGPKATETTEGPKAAAAAAAAAALSLVVATENVVHMGTF